MKLSLNWISEFVDIKHISPEDIANRLTMATAEVEEFLVIERFLSKKVICEIIDYEEIQSPGDKTVNLVTVNTADKTYRTICTAPNVRKGLKAVFALPGAKLSEEDTVSIGEIYGIKSEGVLCSPKELGIGNSHERLLECPSNLSPGTELSTLLPEREVILDIDNKSLTHRPDLWAHYGFAREIAAIYNLTLKPLPLFDLEKWESLADYPSSIEDNDSQAIHCLTCIAFDVKDANIISPLKIQDRLYTLGQNCFGILIDLTNYIALEVGQPTHVYDRNHVSEIRGVSLNEATSLKLLDEKVYSLQKEDLVISNGKSLIGLAGIMGGHESQIERASTKILLESANLKASQVRRTATRLNLRTEASQRFEKTLPPALTKTGVARFLHLLMEDSNSEITPKSKFTVQGQLEDEYRELILPLNFISSLAGTPIDIDRTQKILNSLEFTAATDEKNLKIGIPPFRSRKDISVPNDIGEEVLRIYGYDNLPSTQPSMAMKPVFLNEKMRQEHRIRKYLGGASRFIEVQTYVWMDDEWNKKLNYDPKKTLILKNPVNLHKTKLRNWLLPNLLPLVNKNWAFKEEFNLFEIGSIFLENKETGKSKEYSHLAGVSFSQPVIKNLESLFYDTKATILNLGKLHLSKELTFDIRTENSAYKDLPWSQNSHWGRILHNGKEIGALGILYGKMLKSIVKSGEIVWFEMNLNYLNELDLYPSIKYKDIPVFQDSKRDYTIELDSSNGNYTKLDELMLTFTHPILKKRTIIAVYKKKNASQKQITTYTFRFRIGLEDRTLRTEDIDDFHTKILHFFQKNNLVFQGSPELR